MVYSEGTEGYHFYAIYFELYKWLKTNLALSECFNEKNISKYITLCSDLHIHVFVTVDNDMLE